MEITITATHIEKYHDHPFPWNNTRKFALSPPALAINDTPGCHCAIVTPLQITYYDATAKTWRHHATPNSINQLMDALAAGKPVNPMTFEIQPETP